MNKFKEYSIYRHFKNLMYATMEISRPLSRNRIKEISEIKEFKAMHSETLDIIIIYKTELGYYHNEDVDNSDLVLYKALYNDTGIFARPKDMFLSAVDKIKYPDVEQDYRFQLIK